MSHEFLLWASALGIFFAGFTLGVAVMIVHAAEMSRKIPIPQELVPKVAEVPLPPAWGPPTTSPFMPKAAKLKTVQPVSAADESKVAKRQPASAGTKSAYLDEFNKLVLAARRREEQKSPSPGAGSEPPLQPPSMLPGLPQREPSSKKMPSIWTRDGSDHEND